MILKATRAASIAALAMIISAGALNGANPGVSDSRILLGQTCSLRGAGSDIGVAMNAGLEACFAQVNAEGGVHGRRVELKAIDDGAQPEKCVRATSTLLDKMRVLALIGGVGAETSRAALPVAEAQRAPMVAPMSGDELLRVPHREFTINLRASLHQEMERLIQYLVEEQGYDRIACVHPNTEHGRSAFDGVERALSRRSMSAVADILLLQQGDEIESALKHVAQTNTEAIIIVGDARESAAFIKAARKKTALDDVLFCAPSSASAHQLKQALGGAGEGCVISQVVPFPWDTELPLVAEFHKAMKATGEEKRIGFASLEGYMAGKLFCQALENVRGEPTRAKLLDAFARVGVFDLGGVQVVYGPNDHQGMDLVYLTQIKGRRLAPVDTGVIALVEE